MEDRRLSSVTRQLIEEKKAKEESNRQLGHFQELVEKLEKVFFNLYWNLSSRSVFVNQFWSPNQHINS